jgi:hypothetical protein
MMEHKLMAEGKSNSDSYESAFQMVRDQREKVTSLFGSHTKISNPDYLSCDTGLIDPAENDFILVMF